jgi:RNA polymerase sigma factor (sigma-70 family)
MTLLAGEIEDRELLNRFANEHSEEAFAELVRRHMGRVHSAALRQVGDDPASAADITQAVFMELARQARKLASHPVLVGWLSTTTHRLASHHIRGECRRRRREQEVVVLQDLRQNSDLIPDEPRLKALLDDVLQELGEMDRAAVLLRHVEQRPFSDIGVRLGMSENAARMRVDRALEKLRTRLARRGITSTSSVLVSTLAGASTSVAPPGLATAITSTVLASGFTSPFTFTLLTVMASSPVKIVIALIAVGMVGGVLIHQRNTTERLQSEKSALEQRVAELTSQADSYRLAAEKNAEALAQGARQSAEVLRLRGEVSQLRRQAVPKPGPKAASAKPPEPVEQPTSEEAARAFGLRRMNESKTLLLGLILYASEHDEQFPATLDAAAEHLKSSGAAPGTDETLKNLNLHDFEMIHQGSLTNLANPAMGIVLREREAWRTPEGKWARAYGFGDGHSELHLSDAPDDADWEAAHTVVHQDAPKGGF